MLQTLPLLPEIDWPPPDADTGLGALTTPRGALPLPALDVRARLDGLTCAVEVEQAFVNAHPVPVEATYIFPLPDRAAVTRFRLDVAGRRVEGELLERALARRTYDEALDAGHRAAIAEEERPGAFTLRVGNLPPGERAVVRLSLAGPLPCRDGEVTFRFPLVVAPRYAPGAPLPGPPVGPGDAADTDQAPDASRISPPVLLPGSPHPVRLSLTVDVAAGALAPHSFRSTLHTVAEEVAGATRRFRLRAGERLDRDFVLRYRVGGDRVATDLALSPDAEGPEGTFRLTLAPPAGPGPARRRPRAVAFVLDRSGSMAGWKMVAARRAVARLVEALTDDDRFAVLAFDNTVEGPPGADGPTLAPAGDRQRHRAAEFLANLEARGGTEMAAPLVRAVEELARVPAAEADRTVVLITDGQVANEDHILRRLGDRARGVRIFTLGIDRAVNAAFLRRLADLGGGACELVESEERLDEVMDAVQRQIGSPLLTGLQLRAAGADLIPDRVTPARLPDLFAGAPVVISGRYRGGPALTLTVRGRDPAGEAWSVEVPGRVVPDAPIGHLWARARVRDLEDRYAVEWGRTELEREIVDTSVRFGALSRFTAFVAVDRSEAVAPGGPPRHITQPVEPVQGWGQAEARCLSAPAAAPSPTRAGGGAWRALCASPAPRAAPPRSAGLLDRALGLLWGSRPTASPGGERTPGAMAQSLYERLTDPSLDTPARRLAALRAAAGELRALHEALASAGPGIVGVEPLGRALAQLTAALREGLAAGPRADEVLRAVVEALRACLPTGAAPDRREGFWK